LAAFSGRFFVRLISVETGCEPMRLAPDWHPKVRPALLMAHEN
jgi:hypothetical protein